MDSTITGAIADAAQLRDPLDVQPVGEGLRGLVPLPEAARPILGDGAHVSITVSPWD